MNYMTSVNLFNEQTLSVPSVKDLVDLIEQNNPEARLNKETFKKEMWQTVVSGTREETIKNLTTYDPFSCVRQWERKHYGK